MPSYAPTLADIEAIARAALAEIPEPLRRYVADVPVLVMDFPDPEIEAEMGLESPFDLLGLYQGVSLDRKGAGATAEDVDRIFLFRRPLLDYWCETGESLEAIVKNTLIHEIGHHFGFSDEDMERLEAE